MKDLIVSEEDKTALGIRRFTKKVIIPASFSIEDRILSRKEYPYASISSLFTSANFPQPDLHENIEATFELFYERKEVKAKYLHHRVNAFIGTKKNYSQCLPRVIHQLLVEEAAIREIRDAIFLPVLSDTNLLDKEKIALSLMKSKRNNKYFSLVFESLDSIFSGGVVIAILYGE